MTTYMVRIIEKDTGKEHFVKVAAKNRTEGSKKVRTKVSKMFYNVNGAYTAIEHARLYFKHNHSWIRKSGEFETDWERISPSVRKRAKRLAMESVNLSTKKIVGTRNTKRKPKTKKHHIYPNIT